MALQVGGKRLIELRSAANALRNQQRNYSCRISLLNLPFLPFLNRPRCLADVIHCVSELAQHIGINVACFYALLKLQQFPCCPLQLKSQSPKLFVGREEFHGNSQEGTRRRSPNGRYACLCLVTIDQIHQFDFSPLALIPMRVRKPPETAGGVCLVAWGMARLRVAG